MMRLVEEVELAAAGATVMPLIVSDKLSLGTAFAIRRPRNYNFSRTGSCTSDHLTRLAMYGPL